METKEYLNACWKTMEHGGTLWVIERKDTNEVLTVNIQIWRTDRPHPPKYLWIKGVGYSTKCFLTKEDGENELNILRPFVGGCPHCGNNSTPMPCVVREHEWVKKVD